MLRTPVEEVVPDNEIFAKYSREVMLKKSDENIQEPMRGNYIYDYQNQVSEIPSIVQPKRMNMAMPPMNMPPMAMPPMNMASVQEPMPHMVHCSEIYSHIADCPLCSRFYNMDKTPYYLIITILAIICILLGKKLLEK